MSPKLLVACLFLDVAAELEPHGGQNLPRKIIFAARRKALIQRGAQDRCGRRRFNRRKNCPSALAGVGYSTRETLQRRLLQKGNGGQVKKPRRDHAAAPPHLCHVREIEIILIVLWIP